MAGIPQPLSFSQLLGNEIDVFLSKSGLKQLRVGNPLLSLMEASAQNDIKATQDVFNALNAQDVNRLSGAALKKLAQDESVTVIAATPSSGTVNFVDVSFNKISTNVFQGAAAPNPGTTALLVSNGASFPATGSVYIGRNTLNYEGPLAYSSVVNSGSFWTINLVSGTTKFHNTNETVILAKGGSRLVPTGTVVQTPQGNGTNAVQFATLYNATIPDGETEVDNVLVVCQTPGLIGNVAANTISQVLSQPFVGATVINPLPFTNGQDNEDDESIREAIIAARASRSQGTETAILSGVQGVSSPTDNKTVISASLVNNPGATSVLYIDDGTGYQETTQGVAQEVLMDSALGGEQYFELASPRPIAKAFVKTTATASYNLSSGAVLAVYVGGVRSEHTFNTSDFFSITNASAFEVASSINSDSSLLYSARVSDGGTTVTLFGKSDTNEDLLVTTPAESVNDANKILLFPTTHVYTLRLFKNDKLLYKDGQLAIVQSNPQSLWAGSITSGDTLIISVDGTANQTITITNQDFINLNTGFVTVAATNTLVSWATVLNSKVAGATFAPNANLLQVTSNKGTNSLAKVDIVGGTLTSKNMFVAGSVSTGINSDYVFNRNLGQLKLNVPLVMGDQLVVATSFTRAYAQSAALPGSITFLGNPTLWISFDSNAKIVSTGINNSTSVAITNPSGNRARYTCANGTFANVTYGDWMIVWDTAFADLGQWVVADIDVTNAAWVEIEHSTPTVQTVTPVNNGVVFARLGDNPLQVVGVPSGTYSLSSLIADINGELIGGFLSLYHNTFIRVNTNSYVNGNVMIVTADLNGQKMLLPTGVLFTDNPSHFPVIASVNTEIGTPRFNWSTVATVVGPETFTPSDAAVSLGLRSGDTLAYRKRLDVAGGSRRWGNTAYTHSQISSLNSGNIQWRTNTFSEPDLVNDRFYPAMPFGLGWDDTLDVVLDQDPTNKSFAIPLDRNAKPLTGQTYGNSLFTILDVDNSNNPLSVAFGLSSSLFNDFAVFMRARGKSHSITANKTLLWRYGRYGSEGNYATISYINPSAPNQAMALSTNDSDGNANVQLTLNSGAARTGLNTSGSDDFVYTANTTYTASTGNVTRNANVVTVLLSSTATTGIHTLSAGDQVYQIDDETGGGHTFRTGPKFIQTTSATSFTYNENGANDTSNAPIRYQLMPQPAGTVGTVTALVSSGTHITATIGGNLFAVGQQVYFEPGHFDPTSGVTITAGLKTLTSVNPASSVTWAEAETAGTATLIVGVNYTVSAGAAQKVVVDYYKAECATAALVRSGSTVTATIQTTPIFGTIPFKVSDVVYLSPGEANFPSGPKIVASVNYGANSFTYIEGGAATSSAGVEFFGTTATDPTLTGGGNPVIIGDIVNIGTGTSLDAAIQGSWRVSTVSSLKFSFLQIYNAAITGNTNPKSINAINNLQFYPLGTITANSVNTFIGTNGGTLISSVLVPNNGGGSNNGSATITMSTLDEFLTFTLNASLNGSGGISVARWPLFDGLNFVLATNMPSLLLSQISLKDTVSGELTSNADFNNETFKLVPTTAANGVNYLGNEGVSGLGPNGIVTTSSDGNAVQLGSQTLGSAGAIQISGGTANSTNAAIVGSGQKIVSGTLGLVTISSSQITGFTGGQMVQLEGIATTKVPAWSNSSTLAISASTPGEWLLTFDGGTTVVNVIQTIASVGTIYQIERQGEYMAYIDQSLSPTTLSSSIQPGDYVYINSTVLNPLNTGYFQVVAINIAKNTFWVKNNGIEEVKTLDNVRPDWVKFLTHDSSIPGDVISIHTPIFGQQNIGNFTVSRISEAGPTTFGSLVYVLGNMATAGTTTLGTASSLISLKEGTPLLLVKQIKTIVPTPNTAGFYDLVLTPSNYTDRVSAQNESIMTALDKFSFPTSITVGLDGFAYNTGLLAEVNKVVYGDETNTAVYPGILANGAALDISGPVIKAITVSVAIRLRTGSVPEDVIAAVQNVIATTINQWPVGQDIAIASIIAAAKSIDGVIAASMISPVFSSSNDLIVIQQNQRPLILNIDQNVLISLIGD